MSAVRTTRLLITHPEHQLDPTLTRAPDRNRSTNSTTDLDGPRQSLIKVVAVAAPESRPLEGRAATLGGRENRLNEVFGGDPDLPRWEWCMRLPLG